MNATALATANPSGPTLAPHREPVKRHHIAFPKSPAVTVWYIWNGPDDLPDIHSIEVHGQAMPDSTLSFFSRFGFSTEELQEHILSVHSDADPDFGRD